jgi:hypothetical protein
LPILGRVLPTFGRRRPAAIVFKQQTVSIQAPGDTMPWVTDKFFLANSAACVIKIYFVWMLYSLKSLQPADLGCRSRAAF